MIDQEDIKFMEGLVRNYETRKLTAQKALASSGVTGWKRSIAEYSDAISRLSKIKKLMEESCAGSGSM